MLIQLDVIHLLSSVPFNRISNVNLLKVDAISIYLLILFVVNQQQLFIKFKIKIISDVLGPSNCGHSSLCVYRV